MALSSKQMLELREALADAFDLNALKDLLLYRLDRSWETIFSPNDDKLAALRKMIERARGEGWTADLLRGAVEERPDSASLQIVVSDLLAARPDDRPAPALAAPFVVPFLRNGNFVGREADLDALHAALQAGKATGIRPAGLTGMGGIGKTQLAVEYVFRHQADYPGGVFWVNAAEPLIQGFAALGRALDPETAEKPIDVQIRAITDHLRAHPDALLVLDNVADPAELRRPVLQDLIPTGLPCKVLFTTRQRDLGEFTPVEVTVLPPEPALQLLLRARTEALDPAHPEHTAAVEIAAILGYLPLALEVAGAHLGKMAGRPIAAYRDELLKRGALPVVDDARGGVRDEDLGTRHAAAVEATLRSQWDALQSDDARLLLRVAGQMPEAAAISAERLGLLAGVSAAEDGFFGAPLDAALKALHDASLVRELTEGRVRLHPLVREFVERLTPAAEAAAFRRACVERFAAAYADFETLEDHYARRGVNALEEDLLAALALTDDVEETPPGTALRGLLRVLKREGSLLRPRFIDEPADLNLFAQQIHKYASQTGAKELAAFAARQLARRGVPYFTWRWQTSKDPSELGHHLAEDSRYVENAVAVTPDGRHVLCGTEEGTVIVRDIASGQNERTFTGCDGPVHALAATPDGLQALSAQGNIVAVWDLATGALEHTLTKHSSRVTAVAVTPDGQRALSGSRDCTVICWDLATGKAERTLAGHSDWVTSVAVTPDGQWAMSGSNDNKMIIWDLATGGIERTLEGPSSYDFVTRERVTAVAVTPDGGHALLGSSIGYVVLWDLAIGESEKYLTGHDGYVSAVAVMPDGRRALSGSDHHPFSFGDGLIAVSDLETGERVTRMALDAPMNCLAISPDGATVVCGDVAGTVYCLEYHEGSGPTTND